MNMMAQLNRLFYSLINKRLYAYNAKNSGGSGLAWATLNRQLATFRQFIKAGVDITKSCSPVTHGLLHLAAKHGKVEVVQLFIDHGAKINRFDISLKTPLHLASTYGHAAVVDMLLKHGATLNENTNRYVDETPLHIAAKYGHTEVVRLLLQAGCNVHRTTFNAKETALHLSLKTVQYRSLRSNARLSHRHSQKGKTVIVLIEHGANTHSRHAMGRGRTPLQLAVESDYVKVVQTLLEKGARPWDRIDPFTPLDSPRCLPDILLYGSHSPSRIENAVDLAESRGNFKINQLMVGAMYPDAASWCACG
jgi:ankyrin repeat protein